MFKYIALIFFLSITCAFARIGDTLDKIKTLHPTSQGQIINNVDGINVYWWNEDGLICSYFIKDNHCIVETYYSEQDIPCPPELIASLAESYSHKWHRFDTQSQTANGIESDDGKYIIVVGGGKEHGMKVDNIVSVIGKEFTDWVKKKSQPT